MFDLSFNERLFLSFSSAVGLIAAGGLNALFAPSRVWVRWLLASAGLGLALVSVDSLTPEFSLRFGTIGLGLFIGLFLLGRTRVQKSLAEMRAQLRKPRVAWATLAVAGLGWLGYELIAYQRADEEELRNNERQILRMTERNPYVVDESRVASTDQGTPIHLLLPNETRSADDLTDYEQQMFQSSHLDEFVIRRGPADEGSNCHGWVFTGGKYAVGGHEVATILNENGYEMTAEPKAGDLCIYRDAGENIAHTAIVRGVLNEGTVLVEGKWGRCGVFLHPVDHSCYGTNFNYYRSDRKSHVLSAIP